MTTRNPAPQFQLQANDPHGGVNCCAYSAAMAVDYATRGAVVPTGRRIRELSSEPNPSPSSPGLNLAQIDAVTRKYYGVDLDVRYKLPWTEYETIRKRGHGAVLQIDYSPISTSAYSGSPTFGGGHAIFENDHTTIDPLADGRRPDIWRYDGRLYPRTLMRKAAGLLVIGNNVRVGDGYCYVGFTNIPKDGPLPRYRIQVTKGSWFDYDVRDGVIKGRTSRGTGGFSADCSAPRRYSWPGHSGSYRLVRVTSGAYKGSYINTSSPRVTVTEV